MTPDDLDRILSSGDVLEPSSGFALDVMAAVRREASAPARVSFPWSRFLLGFASLAVMAAAGTVLLQVAEPDLAALAAPMAPLAAATPEIGYATAAVVVSLGLASLPRVLMRL